MKELPHSDPQQITLEILQAAIEGYLSQKFSDEEEFKETDFGRMCERLNQLIDEENGLGPSASHSLVAHLYGIEHGLLAVDGTVEQKRASVKRAFAQVTFMRSFFLGWQVRGQVQADKDMAT